MKVRAERATFRSSPSLKNYKSPIFDKYSNIFSVLGGGDITDLYNSSFHEPANLPFFFHKSIKVGLMMHVSSMKLRKEKVSCYSSNSSDPLHSLAFDL